MFKLNTVVFVVLLILVALVGILGVYILPERINLIESQLRIEN
jgi:hypothetical protein